MARIAFELPDSLKEAYRETLPYGVGMSEELRSHIDEVVESGAEELPEETVRRARRAAAQERGRKEDEEARLRIRVRNYVTERFREGVKPDAIRHGVGSKYEEAETLPEELEPETVREFIDSLLALAYLYEETDSSEFDGPSLAPPRYVEAVRMIDGAYPERHVETAQTLFESVDAPEEALRGADSAVTNGLLEEPLRAAESGESGEESADGEEDSEEPGTYEFSEEELERAYESMPESWSTRKWVEYRNALADGGYLEGYETDKPRKIEDGGGIGSA